MAQFSCSFKTFKSYKSNLNYLKVVNELPLLKEKHFKTQKQQTFTLVITSQQTFSLKYKMRMNIQKFQWVSIASITHFQCSC